MKNIYKQQHAKTKVYRVMFNHNGKRINVGNFDTIEEAEIALRTAQKEHGVKIMTPGGRNKLRAYLTIILGHINTLRELESLLLDKDIKCLDEIKTSAEKLLKRYV